MIIGTSKGRGGADDNDDDSMRSMAETAPRFHHTVVVRRAPVIRIFPVLSRGE